MIYRLLLRPILFQFDAEKVHDFTFMCLSFFGKIPFLFSFIKFLYKPTNSKLETNLFGIKFPSPVGLAAGLDKNAKLINEFSSLGFGFIEIGTVTPKPQDGNPKKRLFRLLDDKAVINRMGFNNDGVEKIASRLKNRGNIIIGGNIGKNKNTPLEKANTDYLISFDYLFDYVDYFAVNVSSPNTENLRDLQHQDNLKSLLNSIQKNNKSRSQPKPVLLKIAPDLNETQLLNIIKVVKDTGLDEITAKPDGFSYLDSKNYKIRYKYVVGSKKPSNSTRDFCENMMRLSKSGIVYRLEDIDKATREGVNKELGHKGRPYDLFKFKGGIYCRHKWMRQLYRLKKNTKPSKDLSDYKKTRTIPKTYIKNPRGTKQSEIAPVNMPNQGAYPK